MFQQDEILLRALVDEDKNRLTLVANNKKIYDNLRDYFPHPYTVADAEYFINLTKKENPSYNFAIVNKGDLCGIIGLNPQKDVYRKSAEIGYWLGEDYWHKGIATVAVKLMTHYIFNNSLHIELIISFYIINNSSIHIKYQLLRFSIVIPIAFKNVFIPEHLFITSYTFNFFSSSPTYFLRWCIVILLYYLSFFSLFKELNKFTGDPNLPFSFLSRPAYYCRPAYY